MAIADGADGADVFERDGLTAAAVIGDGKHYDWNTFGANVFDERFELVEIDISFERVAAGWLSAFVDDEVYGFGAGVFDVGAGGVEVAVVGYDFSFAAYEFEEDAFAGAALVGGQYVFESCEFAELFFECVPAFCAGVGFVAAHDTGPLEAAHGAGSGVGEQVDEDVFGADEEDVVSGVIEDFLAFIGGRHSDWFNDLDTEGFDDGFHGACQSCKGDVVVAIFVLWPPVAEGIKYGGGLGAGVW